MALSYTQYPGAASAPVPGPGSIFTDGILDFSSSGEPAAPPKVDLCDSGVPRTSWPSMNQVYKFSLVWMYTDQQMAENILTEFGTLGLSGFDYNYPGDAFSYRCFWINSPEVHPVDYTALWFVKADLIGVRL